MKGGGGRKLTEWFKRPCPIVNGTNSNTITDSDTIINDGGAASKAIISDGFLSCKTTCPPPNDLETVEIEHDLVVEEGLPPKKKPILHPFFQAVKNRENNVYAVSAKFVRTVWKNGPAPLFPGTIGLCGSRVFDREASEMLKLSGECVPPTEPHTHVGLPCKLEYFSGKIIKRRRIEEPKPLDFASLDFYLNQIIEWVSVGGTAKGLHEQEDDDFEDIIFKPWSQVGKDTEYNTICLPLVVLTGPTRSGKTMVASLISQRLGNISIHEVNSAVNVRTGKCFDDLLTGSDHQKAILSRFIGAPDHKKDESKHQWQFKQIILIDEVDLVFPIDRFYSPLTAFLKSFPPDNLVILTSNSPISILAKHFDLPAGHLHINLPYRRIPSGSPLLPPQEHSLKSAELLSDLGILFGSSSLTDVTHYEDNLDDVAVTCEPWDLQVNTFTLTLTEQLRNYFEHTFDSAPDILEPDACRSDLLDELQSSGFFMNATTKDKWILDYKPFWAALEADWREQQQMRRRRTSRHISPRPYLSKIPCKYVDQLLSPPSIN